MEKTSILSSRQKKRKFAKDPVHHPLEGLGSVFEAKREAKKFKKAKGSDDGGLGNISRPHWNPEITLLEIKFGEEL